MIVALLLFQATTVLAPLEPDRGTISGRAGAAVRAATLDEAASLPPQPVTFRFQCTTDRWGTVDACVEAADPPLTDRDALSRRDAEEATDRSPRGEWRRAARDRLRLVQVGKGPFGAPDAATRSVWLSETVAATDRPALPPPSGTVPTSALVLPADAGAKLFDHFPKLALRHGAEAAVGVTCRVMPDRALRCRDPQIVRHTVARFDRAFEIATIAAFGALQVAPTTTDGRSAIGLDVPMRMAWRLP